MKASSFKESTASAIRQSDLVGDRPRGKNLHRLVLTIIAIVGLGPAALAEGVVIFKTKSIGPYNQAVAGFRSACKAPITEFDMNGDDAQGLALVEQIRASEPEVIFAVGTKAARIAKEKFSELPIVFCMVLNPDRNGVLGPNTTGVLLQIPYSRQFKLLKTVLPTVKVVGVLYDPSKTRDNVSVARQEAQLLEIDLVPIEVSSEKEVPNGLRELLDRKVDMLWLTTDSTVLNKDTFAYIVTYTLERNVPLMAYQASFVKAGAFLALAPSYEGIGEQASRMTEKILQGSAVSELPVEDPDGNLLALNMKVAQQIGLEVPLGVVDLADEVVEP